ERIEVTRLRAKVQHAENADAREAFILFARNGEGALPLFLGIAESAYPDMDLAFAIRRIPVLWIVDAFLAELLCTRRHPDAESLREALQRFLRKAECLETSIADANHQPGIGRVPPIRGGRNMRCEPAEELPACLSIVDAQKHMSAEVRRRPLPQDGRLDLLQVERRRVRRRIRADGFLWRQHGRIPSCPDPFRAWTLSE